ncbi:GGDEF domain-containing protein [Aliikangiella maris]|uniref:Diguanylate cyclase n=2 Tax=Aliikangiella maris TaxID=3162458 RepID=A0ABV3MUN8_9GAMM
MTSKVYSAQLIDSLPSEMSKNWQACLHFESHPASCHTTDLPESRTVQPSQVTYQSFTKSFIPNSQLKGRPLGLLLAHIDDTDKVYLNNQLIGSTGQFPPQFESGYRLSRLYIIPEEMIKFNHFNQIKIQTFSSRNQTGIQFEAPILGDFLTFQHSLYQQNYFYIIFAAILLMLVIFPVFYFVMVKGNQETIYFLLFLVGFAIVTLCRSHLPTELGLNLSSAYKIESFMLMQAMISMSIFIFKFFDLEVRKIYAIGLFILGFAALILIVWPYAIHLRLIAEINYFLLNIITFFVAGSAIIVAIHKQRKYASIFLITCISGWLFLLYDALMQANGLFELNIKNYPQVIPVIAAITGLIFTLTLTHKYWHYFKGSTYDHLTHTLLRPAFFQRLSEEMNRCRRIEDLLLVAVIEIQQAKKISINYGYSIGNHLLTSVSQSLTKVLRPYDLICRFNDEQFCIAASISVKEDAEQCIQRIYDELINIEQPINNQIELYIDARIGGVLYNQEQHLSVSHIVQDANYALSKAKSEAKQSFLLIQNAAMPTRN